MTQNSFGDALKRARTEASLTQRELVERLQAEGISTDQASIARMESGKREPRLSEAIGIARVMGIDLSTIGDQEIDALQHLRILIARADTSDQQRVMLGQEIDGLMTQIRHILSDAPELKGSLTERERQAVERLDVWNVPF
ncbi:helix-turn-helix domain-containing protein [Gordonia sp. (in: high G+C Gram-positive bacteria)]|uniref:helix-turn-helix domain-containing protein n=1 Tax=Gordonia sp. (in: high G+C Gram-positive bacteria) TaxID=84139 RepID=UPI003C70EAFA